MEKTLRVTIFGRHYPLRVTEETEELTRRVAALVEERMGQMGSEMYGQPELSIAILVAMELAEDLLKASEAASSDIPDFTEQIESLTSTLETALSDGSGDGAPGSPPVNADDSEPA